MVREQLTATNILMLDLGALRRRVAHQQVKLAESDVRFAREVGWKLGIDRAQGQLHLAQQVKLGVYSGTSEDR